MPDMEKRLEAFTRIAHTILIFPGGVGTLEELLYLLGILMHPENAGVKVPVIMTGPPSAKAYFEQIDNFVGATLGSEAQQYYQIEIGTPSQVANLAAERVRAVRDVRQRSRDAYYFNWKLKIELAFQRPFTATHENMAALQMHKNQAPHALASNLRRTFSGLVAGNIKEDGIRAIEAHGPFEMKGDPDIMSGLDKLLSSFVQQGRMRLAQKSYQPCYRVVV
jgi:hypothetical protein